MRAVALASLAATTAGCAAPPAGRPSPAELARPMPAVPPSAPFHSGVVQVPPGGSVSVDALVDAVRADAAVAGNAAPSALTLRVESVTWRDGSLGCPRPDVMYTQALVPGWRVIVSDGAREWVYHASRRGAWVRCPAGLAQQPLPGDATR